MNSTIGSTALRNALIGLGCKKGDRLAVMADNCSKYLEVYFGAAKIGMSVTPINIRLGDEETRLYHQRL